MVYLALARKAIAEVWHHRSVAELDSQPKSVQSIYAWFDEGKLFVTADISESWCGLRLRNKN